MRLVSTAFPEMSQVVPDPPAFVSAFYARDGKLLRLTCICHGRPGRNAMVSWSRGLPKPNTQRTWYPTGIFHTISSSQSATRGCQCLHMRYVYVIYIYYIMYYVLCIYYIILYVYIYICIHIIYKIISMICKSMESRR